MPSQGWAGSQAPAPKQNCAVCLIHDDIYRNAVTQVDGTLVCLQHAKWIWTKSSADE